MNSEVPPRPEASPLEAVELHGETLAYWHQWLTTDEATGDPTGHLHAPCSRYGRNGEECSYWAIACEVIYVEANGQDDDPRLSLDYYQGLAVNDSDQVADLVVHNWYLLPRALRQQLGGKRNVRQLMEGR